MKIDQPITGYEVVGKGEPEPQPQPQPATPPKRPYALGGVTYKIHPPLQEHALYLTLNNGVDGTLYEVFANSADMQQYQWIVALTRLISRDLRAGVSVESVAAELQSVHAPSGGYWRKGGKFMTSLVAEIGLVMIEHSELKVGGQQEVAESSYPPEATLCPKCQTKAVILMDGCATCLNCGDSKCG